MIQSEACNYWINRDTSRVHGRDLEVRQCNTLLCAGCNQTSYHAYASCSPERPAATSIMIVRRNSATLLRTSTKPLGRAI